MLRMAFCGGVRIATTHLTAAQSVTLKLSFVTSDQTNQSRPQWVRSRLTDFLMAPLERTFQSSHR
jgi:hypothetical protein